MLFSVVTSGACGVRDCLMRGNRGAVSLQEISNLTNGAVCSPMSRDSGTVRPCYDEG